MRCKPIIFALLFGLATQLHGLTERQARLVTSVATDPAARLVTVVIEPPLLTGTDGACLEAARIFHAILAAHPRYRLFVRPASGNWVPTAVNPMTAEFAAELVRCGGEPVPLSFKFRPQIKKGDHP